MSTLTSGPGASAPANEPRTWDVRSVFHRVVDLDDGSTVGSEALMRGPGVGPASSPLHLLETARAAGTVVGLDLAAVESAVRSALRPPAPGAVFVNVEPATLSQARDALVDRLRPLVARTSVVVEITERALAVDPAGMLDGAEDLRRAGCAIALDDVGAEKESLAFIPILRPEVVKLDLGLLRRAAEPATVAVAGAVRAYAEASGAQVVAEGIETDEDLVRARVLGATWGQGWLWGRPEAAPATVAGDGARVPAHPVGGVLDASPFDIVAATRQVHAAPKRLLLPISRSLESAALTTAVPPVLLAGFQHVRHLTSRTLARYTDLARELPFVAVLGERMPRVPGGDVRGGRLAGDDLLAREWNVTVLGAHDAAALVARERDGRAPADDGERMFDFVVTHDRALVTAVTHAMVGRLAGERVRAA